MTTSGWPSCARTTTQRAALAAVTGSLDDAAIEAWTSERKGPDIERVLQDVGVPVHAVQNSHACWTDPQLVHRNHYLTVEHPVHDTCVVEGPRVQLSRTPGVVRRAGPSMGEHNDEVLRGHLGYDDERITDLVIAGALG